VVEFVGGEYARQQSVHSDETSTQSRQNETELPPAIHSRRPDPISGQLKAELALWRAFVRDEIDAILRDKD
jgi:hypothetical protein